MIMSVFLKAGEELKAGQEIFTNYGYKKPLPFPHDRPWYWATKAQVDKDIEDDKKRNAKSKSSNQEKTKKL